MVYALCCKMEILKVLLILFMQIIVIHTKNECSESYCPNSTFSIRFPFYLENQQPRSCGYPGFNLKCNSQGYTILNLPFSGDFLVQNIRYYSQEIVLNDTDNCTVRRLINLNLSSSPFRIDEKEMMNYTIISCPSTSNYPSTYTSFVLNCLSNSTNKLLAFRYYWGVEDLLPECNIIARNLSIASPIIEFVDTFGFDLTWSVPNCTACENKSELCGFADSMSQEIRCFARPGTGRSRDQPIAKVIALSLAIPVVSLLGLLVFGLSLRRYCNRRRQAASS